MSTDIKASAMHFLTLAAFGNVDEAYEKYVSAGFVHHNPYFRGDRESLKAAMAGAARTSPNEAFDIKHALRDGDFVAVHSRIRKRGQKTDIAVVHLFRFDGGRIVELWDVGQPALVDSANENGMF